MTEFAECQQSQLFFFSSSPPCTFDDQYPGSLGNPFVHSLLVTLGNHAIPPLQPYNCPCPNGHVSLQKFGHRDVRPGTAPPRSRNQVSQAFFVSCLFSDVFCQSSFLDQGWSSDPYGVRFRVQQTESTQRCGEVCPAGQDTERHL